MALKALLLIGLVVSAATGFPAVNVPDLPADRRVEYYVLQGDGGFRYGYDSGEGKVQKVHADPANEVAGSYSYVDPEGRSVSVQYTSGIGGYVPVGGAITTSVKSAASHLSNVGSHQYKTSSSTSDGSYSSQIGVGQGYAYTKPEYTSSSQQDKKVEFDPYYNPNADASYDFSYQTGDQNRQEKSDAKGNVKGEYSYVDETGVHRSVKYLAGSDTGFVASVHPDPASDAGVGVAKTKQQNYYSAGASKTYVPPVPNFASKSSYVPPSPAYQISQSSGATSDGSYSFQYQAADHDRKESADKQGNVVGAYSFVADDGQKRTLNYQAGAATGFVAQGDFLPKAPPLPAVSGVQPVQTYNAPTSQYYQPAPVQKTSYKQEEQEKIYPDRTDKSYSFSYDADSHGRKESADAQGNVVGSYAYVGADGVTRSVQYEAGGEKGFVVKGDVYPSGNAAVSSGSNVRYAAPAPVVKPFVPPVVAPVVAPVVPPVYKSYLTPVAPAPAYVPAPVKSTYSGSYGGAVAEEAKGDASYSFSYSADDHSRHENSNPEGYVTGQYSYVADDGKKRTLSYEAGPEKGFVVSGDLYSFADDAVVTKAETVKGGYGALGAHAAKSTGGFSYQTQAVHPAQSGSASSHAGKSIGGFSYQTQAVHPAQSGAVSVASQVKSGASSYDQQYSSSASSSQHYGGLARAIEVHAPTFKLQKYIPAGGQKFGYVFDSY